MGGGSVSEDHISSDLKSPASPAYIFSGESLRVSHTCIHTYTRTHESNVIWAIMAPFQLGFRNSLLNCKCRRDNLYSCRH